VSSKNKVVWTEGLFLKPQHFQQERRYLEHYIEHRTGSIQAYGWGFTELEIDRDMLGIGKIGIVKAAGVFPDGTPFVIPTEDATPAPVEIDEQIKGQMVYLCIPVRSPGGQEYHFGDHTELTRHEVREIDVRDDTSDQVTNNAVLQVAGIQPELRLESQVLEGYATLGLVHVIEAQTDRQIILDDSYIYPTLDSRTNRRIDGLLSEVRGLLVHRAEELEGLVTTSSSDVSQFLLLQTVNRYTPVVSHFASSHGLHPRTIYQTLLEIAGDLSTFREQKRPIEFPAYDQDDLRGTFDVVMGEMRKLLQSMIVQRAVRIPIEQVNRTTFLAQINDRDLLDSATFNLAVSANHPPEFIQQRFPNLSKLAAKEDIKEVVGNLTDGVGMRAMPTAPREIPYHQGNVYFELDRRAELWQGLKRSGGLAIHLLGDFPGLKLELWAVRE
jgi:type VI secretion system protein ImpJ